MSAPNGFSGTVATYGNVSIVRVLAAASDPREYGEQFYVLYDRDNARIGRTFRYLRNARKEAARLNRAGY